jgi:sulfur-carrier protein
MRVMIPSVLRSYTGASAVEARGGTLDAVLCDIEARAPGFRFRMIDEQDRIRRHIRVFVNGCQVFDLRSAVSDADEIVIAQALSGG